MGIGEKLQELLDKRRRNVNDLAKATGVSASTIYSIIRRNNTKVDLDILQLIADELCVTLDYFSDLSSPTKQAYYLDEETAGFVQEILNNPDLKILIDASRKATPEDLRTIAKMVSGLVKEDYREDDD